MVKGFWVCDFHLWENTKETMTEEELRTIVQVGHEEGVIEKEEQQMIDNHKQTRRYSGLRARLAGENG